MKADELEPCPFCGGKAYLTREPCLDGFGGFHSISCVRCRAKSGELYAVETCSVFFGQVRDSWNTRAGDLIPAPMDVANWTEGQMLEAIDTWLSSEVDRQSAVVDQMVKVQDSLTDLIEKTKQLHSPALATREGE